MKNNKKIDKTPWKSKLAEKKAYFLEWGLLNEIFDRDIEDDWQEEIFEED